MIKVYYTACDGARITRSFKTLKGARKFATDYVGKSPEMGRGYAVSGDGVGKVTVDGCTLKELFAVAAEPAEPDWHAAEEAQERAEADANREAWEAKYEGARAAYMSPAEDDGYPF